MSKLKVTLTIAVNEDDKDGVEEIYLRSLIVKFREILDVAMRGNVDVQTTYERAQTTRRPSERKPKTKRSLK